MDWRLHEVKSKQFANLSSVRRWLQHEAPTISAGTEIRDLGVVAVAGKRRSPPVSAARLQLASGRFARLRRLPVPFHWRCLMGASAGTAAGTYGSSCGRPSARELEQLRRAAKAATGHGPRASAEIMFGVISPTWRLGPKAVVIVAPVLQAGRALRAGQLDLASWRTTAAAIGAGAGRAVGPVAAALRSLRELGLGGDMECWFGVPTAPPGVAPGRAAGALHREDRLGGVGPGRVPQGRGAPALLCPLGQRGGQVGDAPPACLRRPRARGCPSAAQRPVRQHRDRGHRREVERRWRLVSALRVGSRRPRTPPLGVPGLGGPPARRVGCFAAGGDAAG